MTIIASTDGGLAVADYVALGVAVAALLFTVGSWWWLHARPGRLHVWEPRSYGAATGGKVGNAERLVLRLPLVLYNDGATPIVVEQLRVTIDGFADRGPSFSLQATHPMLYGQPGVDREYATGFAVPGRNTIERTYEFQRFQWAPIEEGAKGTYSFKLHGKLYGERRLLRRWKTTRWTHLLDFTLNDMTWVGNLAPQDNRIDDEPTT